MVRRVRPARHYQHPQAPVRRLADEAIIPVARAFRTSLKAAKRLFDPEKATYLIANGRWREVHSIIDWHHADEAMRHPMNMLGDVWLVGGGIGARKINGIFTSHRRVVRFRKQTAGAEERPHAPAVSVYSTGGQADAGTLPEDRFAAMIIEKDQADLFNFDRYDPVTQTHIRDYQDALITSLGQDSRNTIESVILNGMRAGLTPADMVDQIRRVIGLTDRQAAALLNFRRALAAEGSPHATDPDTVDRLVDRREEEMLASRALSIATTEATRAASLGLQDSYEQAINRGAMPAAAVRQYWQISLDEKTCDHCLSVVDMNPDGVPFGEQFESDDGPIDAPPYHPNCRCSLEFVTDLDLIPDEDG